MFITAFADSITYYRQMRLLQSSTLDYYTLRANEIGLVVAGITLAQHILILVMKCRKCV